MGNTLSAPSSSPHGPSLLIRVQFLEFRHITSTTLPNSSTSLLSSSQSQSTTLTPSGSRNSSSTPPSTSSILATTTPSSPEYDLNLPSFSYILYIFTISYQRYVWKISKRFSEIKAIRKYFLQTSNAEFVLQINFPRNHFRINTKPNRLLERGELCARFIEILGSNENILKDFKFRRFLEIGKFSLNPSLGRKGKGGPLKMCSGGYTVKLSNTDGMFHFWSQKWVEAHDNCIVYYQDNNEHGGQYEHERDVDGILRIDSGLSISSVGRYIIIQTNARKLSLRAPSRYHAYEWRDALVEFYTSHQRTRPIPFHSSFPPRDRVEELQVFTCSKDYYYHVARSLLMAKEEILISAWKLSPKVLLTRPPLPPLRLDQILRYKAHQGIKIYILLYQEVGLAGQGNDSNKAKNYLISLHPNISVIRHPNKLFGRTKAILWSHHEKLVIVDRTVAYVGGLDLSLNRYDDMDHRLEDQSGLLFPGPDYRQNAPGLLKPVRPITRDSTTPVFFDSAHVMEGRMSSLTSFERLSTNISFTPPLLEKHPHQDETVIEVCSDEDDESEIVEPEIESPEETAVREMAEMESVNVALTATEIESNNDEDDTLSIRFIGGFRDISSRFELQCSQLLSRPVRELYPRLGWHDVHAKITGLAARDVSSHFIQRWNFHRTSKSKSDKVILLDVTDNPNFGECAACHQQNISEVVTVCPRCGYALGSCSPYFIPRDPNAPLSSTKLPEMPTYFAFIDFEVTLTPPTGLTLSGDGPVAIECISADSWNDTSCGTLKHSQGRDCLQLIERGLFPCIGDLFILVDDVSISHLSTEELQKFVEERGSIRMNQVKVLFRRYYIHELDRLYKKSGINSSPLGRESMKSITTSESSLNSLPSSKSKEDLASGVDIRQSNAPDLTVPAPRPLSLRPVSTSYLPLPPSYLRQRTRENPQNITPPQATDTPIVFPTAPSHQILVLPEAPTHSAICEGSRQSHVGVVDIAQLNNSVELSEVELPMATKRDKMKLEPVTEDKVVHFTPLFLPESILPLERRKSFLSDAIAMELHLRASIIVHVQQDIPERQRQVPAHAYRSCQVQVLRSSGRWSVGENTEHSIQNAYIHAIETSEHLIYIENQFFIGCPENVEGVEGLPQNKIVMALFERLVKAIQFNQHFRVIVIIPQHPSGDFLNHESPRIIYHYEYNTICRGGKSLYELIRNRFPYVNPAEYISFHCLRNWGVMNSKVVSEQIYVHDKVLIVDDRIAIIGSANLNDRSMLGDRDSEMAIRIEDTDRIPILLGGNTWEAGRVIHQIRMNLMRQHIGERNPSEDSLSDMAYHAPDNSNDPFHLLWLFRSNLNSSIYDWLDGEDVSIYRCRSLAQLRAGLQHYTHKAAEGPLVKEKLLDIEGYLINFPLHFLEDDDLSPPLTFRPLAASNLWL